MKNDTPSDLHFCLKHLTRLVRFSKGKGALKRQREPLRGLLASFALAIGAGLCSPANAHAPVSYIHVNDKIQAMNYAKGILSKSQYLCLRDLYTKESNWRRTAYNKSGAYGIPQLKNKMIKNMSGSMQTMYGIKYINARYQGDTCLAYKHWKRYGWH
jgi:hypothetical protein